MLSSLQNGHSAASLLVHRCSIAISLPWSSLSPYAITPGTDRQSTKPTTASSPIQQSERRLIQHAPWCLLFRCIAQLWSSNPLNQLSYQCTLASNEISSLRPKWRLPSTNLAWEPSPISHGICGGSTRSIPWLY